MKVSSVLTLAALLAVAQVAQAEERNPGYDAATQQRIEELRKLDTNNDGVISDEERAAAEDAGE